MVFQVTQQRDTMRTGTVTTRHGVVVTPFFMPDATRASVRGLTNAQLRSVGVVPMVVNTYHLLLQPGVDLVRSAGGVHRFMQWDGPLLSDSGGYQVYSLIHKNASLGKITEEGAVFKSVLDGRKHILTPEKAISIQFDLGVDMMVMLDDPRPNDASRAVFEGAVDRTVRWAQRCKDEYDRQVAMRGMDDASRPLLFGVVQGGPFADLRAQCAQALHDIGCDGYGFGGRHVDAEGRFMEEIVAHTAANIASDAPRFALGIGTPSDIVRCHTVGWDMFDCVIPTREGRHGRLFVYTHTDHAQMRRAPDDFYHTITITNARYRHDFAPIDPTCTCYACANHTRAYIQHLFRVGEPLGAQLAALHNLRFFMRLMELLRIV